MILSKNERTKLQTLIHGEMQKTEIRSLEHSLFLVIAALLSDFAELENTISQIYAIFASGKEVNELLDSLSEILSSDLVTKLHLEGQHELIQSLTALANNAQSLKCVLSRLHDKKSAILQ